MARGRTGAWAVLVASGACESLWAHAVDAGLRSPGSILVFCFGLAASLAGLRVAMRTIPLGTAYAVWTAVGVVVTAAWAAHTGEAFTWPKVLSLGLVILGAAGLQLTAPPAQPKLPPDSRR